ncbi:MAG: DUF4167 domain-containing protein [Oceanicola sp.]|nr:DUF4167 domain-containing protein [Oceanicola sp.]
MRSSKSRSRSKSNRSRSMGNIVNRVFDSSGPEGKVRGTPQQIIDKYSQLARDASLANDRVAAENFQQHAEHYTRMLGEAQREMEAKREQQEAQQQAQRERQQAQHRERQAAAADAPAQPDVPMPGLEEQPDVGPVVEPTPSAETGLVETPENKPAPKQRRPRSRKPRAPEAVTEGVIEAPAEAAPAAEPASPAQDSGDTSTAAE